MRVFGFLFVFQFLFSQIGYSFLTQSQNAVGLASANSFLAQTDALTSIVLPSALSAREGFRASASQMTWLEDVSSTSLAAASAFGSFGFGAYVSHYAIEGNELRVNPTAEPLGKFENTYSVFGVALSHALTSSLRLGASMKWTREKLYSQTASASAMDFSASYSSGAWNGFVSINNVLQSLEKLGDKKTELPQMQNVGVSYTWEKARLGAELHQVTGLDDEVITFAEYNVSTWFSLRAGYHSGDDVRSVSGGFTVDFYGVELSYGYASHEYLDAYSAVQLSVEL